jgi:branched-chain amino acid transport system ATP-binding protein
MKMLSLHDVHANYGPSHIVQGIDLAAQAGEVIGIFGRNGVGKTTLLKTIAGWIKPSRGEILLGGKRIDAASPDRIARMGVSFVPEDRRIFPGLTVAENLELGLLQAPCRSAAAKRAALNRTLIRLPRLRERHSQLGTTLSGGEQQMLAMARAMVGEPRLLLVDEPSEGLAPLIVDEIYMVLAEMKRAGCAMLLVEQNVLRALALCDRFVAIERGKVVLSGHPSRQSDCDQLISVISI